MRHRRFNPAPGIDFIKQQLEGITSRDGDLHRLSRPSVSAIEQLADRSNPSRLALCSQRQACQFDNNRRRMLTREFLHLAGNFRAPTRITLTLAASFLIPCGSRTAAVARPMLYPAPGLPDITLIENVRFSTRIRNALNAAGMKTIGEVRETSDDTLLSLPDLGPGSVAHLRKTLGAQVSNCQ
jgi:hypothetical protein